MGVGRRMQKQGPPEPLSEEHFAKLKRKAGLPVDEVPAEPRTNKKRRTAREAAAKGNGVANKKGAKPNGAAPVKKPAAPAPKVNGKKGKKAPQPQEDEDDVSDGLGDFDMGEDDEFSDLEAADDINGLKDDFLDSDDSVYDSDDAGQPKAMFSEDEDDSDAEEQLTAANIAGLSRKLDEKLAQEEADAQAEWQEGAMQTNIVEDDKPHVLDDDEEEGLVAKTKALLAPDLQLLRTRITDTIRVLSDFGKLSEEGRSRAEYTAQLLKDICAYYGYSEYLAEKLYNLFTPQEAFAFFEANETARPIVIRTNTLRTHRRDLAQALINRGVVLEPVGKWSKIGLQIFESQVPLGATPEYLAGQYILQAASSFLPVMALAPQEGERVLDMAAAPGGKTTHMAAMMKNTGCIFANDPSKQRAKGLIGNIHRLGARNVIVCNYDARDFPRVMGGFDRVLLDAPCSGTGVIAKDASVKTNKTERDFMVLPHTQKQLLLAAVDSVNHASKTGGYLVYSTCSVTIEENEGVVNYVLSRRPNVKLVDTDLPFGKEGFTSYEGKHFDPSLNLTRRYYPHTYNVDGFFVAKFQKTGPSPAQGAGREKVPMERNEVHEVIDKTPITDDENGAQDDDFGDFDEGADEEYIERAKRNAMRRRGLDPNALNKGKAEKNGVNETKAEKAEKSEKSPKAAEKVEKSPKTEKSAKSAKPSKAEKADKSPKADKVEKSPKTDKVEKSPKAEKVEKSPKADKVEKVETSKKEKKKSKKA
ncbi:NOL1/NOP2/sun family-domain-containing protein [Truncatella angustata]|uniref:Nucleolar protein 2 n=1 Tax=Truncatella angustata TaxID=152316 RepID=A0A9P8RMQ3_9PEZI|nr:NOL1/NOP2/sun family-domain-containing protein [Truncatella angustata]KAH6645971.1 NOL1/NOP2/sun family-domain-containing protein [Truncatella angustata]